MGYATHEREANYGLFRPTDGVGTALKEDGYYDAKHCGLTARPRMLDISIVFHRLALEHVNERLG